jgi:hypothetical protein
VVKTRKEAELSALTKELNQVVKEQKDKIDDLTSKNQISFGIFEVHVLFSYILFVCTHLITISDDRKRSKGFVRKNKY